jgi:hypothetical protein
MIGMVRRTGSAPAQIINAIRAEAGIRKKLQVKATGAAVTVAQTATMVQANAA